MRTKKTLRKLPPLTRAIARNLNAIELATTRIDKLMAHLEKTEHDSMALWVKTQKETSVDLSDKNQEGEGLF